MNLSQLSDDQLKLFIQNIFVNYDRNRDGYLEAPELALFFTDLYRSVGYNVVIDLPTAQRAINQIDSNGRISAWQIYQAFKLMIANQQAYLQSITPIGYGQTNPYQNPYQQNNGWSYL